MTQDDAAATGAEVGRLDCARIPAGAIDLRRPGPEPDLDSSGNFTHGESRYRSIVEDQTELISLAQADGTLVYVNQAYARHFGLRPEAMQGSNLFDWVDALDHDAVRATIAEVLAGGEPCASENRMRAADGSLRWVAWTNRLQLEAGQRLLRSVGRDVTERILADNARQDLEQQAAAREHFLRQLTDALPIRIAYLDRERRYRFANAELLRQLGRSREQVLGRTRAELIHPAEDTLVEPALAALRGQPQRLEFEDEVDGQRRRFESRLIPDRDDAGQVIGFFAVGVDITERSAAEQALRSEHAAQREVLRQTATMRSMADAIPSNIAVTDRDGRYRFVNRAFERWNGRPREQIQGHGAREILGDAEFERRLPWIERASGGETVHFELAYPSPVGESHLALTYVPLRLDSGEFDGIVVVTQDISGHKREASRLLRLAQRDPLTGLLNRAGFEQALQFMGQDEGGLAVLYIDLDHFKPVNDRHGHPAGDRVLQGFAQRLSQSVRPTDAVARLGGDEFAIALPGIRQLDNARRVADKVLAAARAPFSVGALELQIGASVGVAFAADAGQDWRELVVRADDALLRAKAAGRGRQAGPAD